MLPQVQNPRPKLSLETTATFLNCVPTGNRRSNWVLLACWYPNHWLVCQPENRQTMRRWSLLIPILIRLADPWFDLQVPHSNPVKLPFECKTRLQWYFVAGGSYNQVYAACKGYKEPAKVPLKYGQIGLCSVSYSYPALHVVKFYWRL